MGTLQTILVVVLFVAIGLGVVLLLGWRGVQPFTVVYNFVAGYAGGFNIQQAISNPTTLVAAGGTALTVGGAAISKISSIKQQATQTVTAAKDKVSGLESSLSSKTSELQTATANLETAQAKITQLEAAAKAAPAQIQLLQDENAKMKTQLDALNNVLARADVLAENKEVVVTKVL